MRTTNPRDAHSGPSAAFATLLLAAALLVLIIAGDRMGAPTAVSVTPSPTPYHEGVPSPIASPGAELYPLPAPADRASADAMAAGGAAMVQAAAAMDDAATIMLASNDPQLVAMAHHWVLDAQALRQQAAWMVLSATAADMVHDPARAHEINAWNLKGNGMAMVEEGVAMREHGQTMIAQAQQLRQRGALPQGVADQLIAAGQDLVTMGEAAQRDGQRMEDDADQMLKLIGG